jgi:hypothetical protein
MGPAIVRDLLERTPPVRLLYRPHPLTGTLNARARAAHREILRMIADANAARDADERWREQAGAGAGERAQAAAELARLDAELAEAAGPAGARPAGDEAQVARDHGPGTGLSVADRETALADWHRAYWVAEGPWRHRVTGGARPTLDDCFAQADLLIADIVATGKPYVVTNLDGHDEHRFRTGHTVTAAAYPLGPDRAELDRIVGYLEQPGPDPLAEQRRDLRAYLLGPDKPDALTRFQSALDDLITRAASDHFTRH